MKTHFINITESEMPNKAMHATPGQLAIQVHYSAWGGARDCGRSAG